MSLKIFNDKGKVVYMTRDGRLISQILKIDQEGGRAVISEESSSEEETESDVENIVNEEEGVDNTCGCHVCPKHESLLLEDMFEWLQAREQQNDDGEISIEEEDKKKKKKRKVVL